METAAVIGAGYSGLLTAMELQKSGYEVTVFEKNTYPGGQCLSLPAGGGIVELGCVFATSRALTELCSYLNVDIESNYFYRQYLDSLGQKTNLLEDSSIMRFKEEYHRLPGILSEYEDCLETAGLYDIPEDLKTDFLSWCKSKKITVLTEVFKAYFTAYGYGDLSRIPAVYVLKHLDRESLSSLVESRKVITFPGGSSSLCHALAEKLKDIRYGYTVNKILYRNQKVQISHNLSTEAFDKVIITTPLKPGIVNHPYFSDALESFTVNVSNALVYKISPVSIIDSFILENADLDGKLRLMHVNFNNSDHQMISVYSNGKRSLKELDKSMRETMKLMSIDNPVLSAYRFWNFFPHIDTERMKNNFFEELHNHQGDDGIYLGAALCCCSSLDKITEFVPEFVKKYL